MNGNSLSMEVVPKIRLKASETFFAAGDSFERASLLLSDGAFKLFAHLCVRADRRTGQHEVTLKQLATSLKKSRRIISRYAAEIRAKSVCKIQIGSNQFVRTVFEICDDYWPYMRSGDSSLPVTDPEHCDSPACTSVDSADGTPDLDRGRYVETIRHTFITLGCTRGIFRSADGVIAQSFFSRGIPLAVVTDALFVGAVRKYVSWLNGNASEMIASVKYFEAVVDELLENPLPLGYSEYMREKLKQLQDRWLDHLQRVQTL